MPAFLGGRAVAALLMRNSQASHLCKFYPLLLPDAASPPMARATQTSREASTPLAIMPCSEGYDRSIWLHPKSSTTKGHLQTPRTTNAAAHHDAEADGGWGPSSAWGDRAGLVLQACALRGNKLVAITM